MQNSALHFSLHAVESVLLVNINPDSRNSQDQTWKWQQSFGVPMCAAFATTPTLLGPHFQSWKALSLYLGNMGVFSCSLCALYYFRWGMLMMLLSYCTRIESCNNIWVWILSSNFFNRTLKLYFLYCCFHKWTTEIAKFPSSKHSCEDWVWQQYQNLDTLPVTPWKMFKSWWIKFQITGLQLLKSSIDFGWLRIDV